MQALLTKRYGKEPGCVPPGVASTGLLETDPGFSSPGRLPMEVARKAGPTGTRLWTWTQRLKLQFWWLSESLGLDLKHGVGSE